jgi:hypothetical protein
MGEGLLRVVKPTLNSPNRKNWHQNLMTTLLRERGMMLLENDMVVDCQDAGGIDSKKSDGGFDQLDDYCTYASVGKLVSAFEHFKPLSVIAVAGPTSNDVYTTRYFACVKRSTTRYLREFKLSQQKHVEKFGSHYYLFTHLEEDIELSVPVESGLTCIASCVMLPYVQMSEDDIMFEKYYTLIDSNWNHSTENGRLGPYHSSTTATVGV